MAKILVIEDDDSFRFTLAERLRRAGHSIVEASDGQRGIDLFQVKEFDLVISDILMPEEDGIGVLNELNLLEKRPKIIMISGGGRMTSAEQQLTFSHLLGADCVLQKPFSGKEILAAISELLKE